jgi:hypothetical protein
MNAICNLNNIQFYGVLQPCIGSSEVTKNNNMLVSEKWALVNDQHKWNYDLEQLLKGYDHIGHTENLTYMYNFSTIFDKEDLEKIYPFDSDPCHISQEGNRIVAENLFKILFENKTGTILEEKNITK